MCDNPTVLTQREAERRPSDGRRYADLPCCGQRSPDLVRQVRMKMAAIRLTALGARAGLVRQLTGLEKKVINRLYLQWHGRPSPSGLQPFSDAWFVKDARRMLHATIIWHLVEQFKRTQRNEAEVLIDVYETYLGLVDTPLLDLTRTVAVSQLVAAQVWHERLCRSCGTAYVTPLDANDGICPGCERYQRFRCDRCGTAIDFKPNGRHRVLCATCRRAAKR